ncbi:MAG: hypothetical protein AAFY56_03490 [Pseudomonadota bacterium]
MATILSDHNIHYFHRVGGTQDIRQEQHSRQIHFISAGTIRKGSIVSANRANSEGAALACPKKTRDPNKSFEKSE